MENIGTRIKAARKELKLSQTEFGAHIGVGLGVVRNIESSLTVPNDVLLDLICNIYDLNRDWLKTGEGEMFRDKSREEELAEWAASLYDVDASFKRRFVYALSKLDESDWRVIEHFAQMLYDEQMEEDKHGRE